MLCWSHRRLVRPEDKPCGALVPCCGLGWASDGVSARGRGQAPELWVMAMDRCCNIRIETREEWLAEHKRQLSN